MPTDTLNSGSWLRYTAYRQNTYRLRIPGEHVAFGGRVASLGTPFRVGRPPCYGLCDLGYLKGIGRYSNGPSLPKPE